MFEIIYTIGILILLSIAPTIFFVGLYKLLEFLKDDRLICELETSGVNCNEVTFQDVINSIRNND